VIEGTGHFSFQQKPEEFSAIVTDFLKNSK
jgi:pimeloyl-ACP methyl ester carboxylesterase